MDTRKTLIACALAAAVMAVSACNNDAGNDTAAMGDDTALGADPMGTDMLGQDAAADGAAAETLALVMAVDRHEIEMAEQAREKGVEGAVLEYADMLHRDHTANLEADERVADTVGISPEETEAVQAQQEKGHQVMERLAGLEGEEYARAFVDAMVQGHTDALAMLEQRITTASDQEMQQHLTNTRDAIARHLEVGQGLQDGGAGTTTGDTGGAMDGATDGAADDAAADDAATGS